MHDVEKAETPSAPVFSAAFGRLRPWPPASSIELLSFPALDCRLVAHRSGRISLHFPGVGTEGILTAPLSFCREGAAVLILALDPENPIMKINGSDVLNYDRGTVSVRFYRRPESDDDHGIRLALERRKELKKKLDHKIPLIDLLPKALAGLKSTLENLNGNLQHIRRGEVQHLPSAVNCIRKLVISTNNNNALLRDVAAICDAPLFVYVGPDRTQFDVRPAYQHVVAISATPNNISYLKTDLDIWLDRTGFASVEKEYSNALILKTLADKIGSHFDYTDHEIIDFLQKTTIGSIEALNQYVFMIGNALVEISKRIYLIGEGRIAI